MPTAVITRSAQTQLIAGMTRVQFSGMDSTYSGVAPADCALRARKMVWDFGDGTPTVYGMHVSHVYPTPGTYVASLTVTWDDGSSSFATWSGIGIAAVPNFSAQFLKYVDPAMPNDNGNGNTPATAYKTLERAFSAWITYHTAQGNAANWGEILCAKGASIPFSGTNDGTHFPTPKSGPLLISSYGVGTRPNIAVQSALELDIDESTDTSYDHPVFIDGVDWTWPTPASSSSMFQFNHRGNQFTNSIVSNCPMIFRAAGSSYANFQIQYGMSANFVAASFVDFDTCKFNGNGNNNPLHHQLYSSTSTHYAGIRNCIFDGTGALASYSGLKTDASTKVYVLNPQVINTDCGFDVGSNGENGNTQDYVIENPTLTNIGRFGFYPQACDRVSVRNPVVLGGCSQGVIIFQAYDAARMITDFQFLNGSLYHPGGPFCYIDVSAQGQVRQLRIVIENNAVQKAVGSGVFHKTESGATFVNFTFKNNQYYRDGGSAGDAGFAAVGGTNYTFTSWQTAGFDVGAQFGDPQFLSGTDLHLQPTSPCIDKGLALGVIGLDYFGNPRPSGAAYDIGAAESQSGAGFMTFRQYFSEMRVNCAQIGFESFAAIDACVLAAIASNPYSNWNYDAQLGHGDAWVYPGTDDGNPAHVFVFRHKRWERGLNLWYVICGQDDGTEAHETGIPGYAIAFGYDATLQALMTKYATDVGDPTVSSKSTHYEVCWRKKQNATSPPAAPPAPLNPIFTETAVVNPIATVIGGGGNQQIQLTTIWSETSVTLPGIGGSPPGNIPLLPIFCDTLVGTVTPFVPVILNVPLLRIFSATAVNDISAQFIPATGNEPLLRIWSETKTVDCDYSVVGGSQGVNLQPIFSETDTTDLSISNAGGSQPSGLQTIWTNTVCGNVTISVIGSNQHVNLQTIWSESATQPPSTQVQGGGSQNQALSTIYSEAVTQDPSFSVDGNQTVPLLTIYAESFVGTLDFLEINPGVYNLAVIYSETSALPVDALLVSTPQASSIGEFSGEVELEGKF